METAKGLVRMPKVAMQGARHDCDYVKLRNSMLATAERNATREAGPPAEGPQGHQWNRVFANEMERLMRNL